MAHGVVQQSMSAVALGMVLGYIAVQTGSIIPCMLFHMSYNALGLSTETWPQLVEKWPCAEFVRPYHS